MISLRNVSKSFKIGQHRKIIATNLSIDLPGNLSIGLLGRNGAGKSTLLRMIAGIENPDSGRICHTGSISWPVGLAGSFHPELTGAQNIRFVARIYGVDTEQLIKFVFDFSELGQHFYAPLRTYSSGMKARLGFGVSMGIHFDTYLIDEVTSVGDAAFKKKSSGLLRSRIGNSGALVVSHSVGMLKQICDAGLVLHAGEAHYFDDINLAIKFHETMMGLMK